MKKEFVWVVSLEFRVDVNEFVSHVSLFRNYDDALAAFQEQIEEETELLCDDEDDTWTEEDKGKNGAIWWHIEDTTNGRYSTVELCQVGVA